jgi:hypothetical protein
MTTGGSGSGAVVVTAFAPRFVLRVDLPGSAGSLSAVDSVDFVVVRERRVGTCLTSEISGITVPFLAPLADLRGQERQHQT